MKQRNNAVHKTNPHVQESSFSVLYDYQIFGIQRFGGISRVFEANMSDLMQVDGVKEHTATLLKLQTIIYKMYLKDKYEVKNEKLTPYSAGQFAIKLFYGYTVEVLFAIMLDAEFRLISWKNRLAPCRSMGRYPISSMISRRGTV